MKQKKNKSEDAETMSTSSEMCNGVATPVNVKPILKTNIKRQHSSGSMKKPKKKNHVQFNEALNKFFDADYVILIRDDDEYDGDMIGCDCEDDYCFEDCYEDYEDYNAAKSSHQSQQQKQKYDLCAAFEPPMEFVDQVTLSPPDGYKDCSPHHCFDQTEHQHHQESCGNVECAKSKSPNEDNRYIVETQTITITTVTDKRIVQDNNQQAVSTKPEGILKHSSLSSNKSNAANQRRNSTERNSISFEEKEPECNHYESSKESNTINSYPNPTINTNVRKNSAVGQLFPGQKIPPYLQFDRSPDSETSDDRSFKLEGKYVVPEDSLRLHDMSRKSKLFNIIRNKNNSYDGSSTNVSDEEDIPQNELIRKTIQRNTLRRSLQRHPRDRKKKKDKNSETLVERIKKLTCDIDEPIQTESLDAKEEAKEGKSDENKEKDNKVEYESVRCSPSGEESPHEIPSEHNDKIGNPTGVSSTYRKLTDLFSRRSGDKNDNLNYHYQQSLQHQISPPDLGNGQDDHPKLVARHSITSEARRQFLSSLAPLTACVTGHLDESPMVMRDLTLSLPHDRTSIASTMSTGTDYSLEDIDKGLKNVEDKKSGAPQPDVIAGTPAGDSNINDELANFVQQDASRIEKIKKRYSGGTASNSMAGSDDENDDYGFNRRPSVKGIKPRFGSTNEILQQIQSQLEPPVLACSSRVGSHMTWPYYIPETDSRSNSPGPITILSSDGYAVAEKSQDEAQRGHICQQQKHVVYTSSNNVQHVMRLGGDPTRLPNVSMMVPYQTEFGIPGEYLNYSHYNVYPHKPMPDNVVQMRVAPPPDMRIPHHIHPEPHYSTQPLPPGTTSVIRVGTGQQQTIKVPCPAGGPVQVHLLTTRRNESPQRGGPLPINSLYFQQNQQQMVVARGTQTASISSSYYIPQNVRAPYITPLVNGNPRGTIYPDFASKTNNNYATLALHRSSPVSSVTSSPTRKMSHPKTCERGVPEGAATTSFTNDTSPIEESQVPLTTESNSVYYTMNV
ncbi:uncharacterized protein LOC103509851 [Diaphorina citri]|uniref:Uncharacterized protein LOC103509851 n=1 Tax=Diaphorina citri TaxID=121845 RepID=A0A1S4EC72_DIACI|nr:uncharacterized protein LOC103509851 [Diaphorina citri]